MYQSLTVVFLAIVFHLVSISMAESQALFNPKIGSEVWSFKDEIDLDSGSHHSGQTVGFDVFISDSRFLFVPGFHYHHISLINKKEGLNFKWDDENHVHYFSIPMTVGYKIFDLAVVDFSALGGGEVFFYYDLDHNDLGLVDDDMYGVNTTITGMLHATVLNFITADIKYRYGLLPIIRGRPESKMQGWTINLGIMF
jgi:hypothetical protein